MRLEKIKGRSGCPIHRFEYTYYSQTWDAFCCVECNEWLDATCTVKEGDVRECYYQCWKRPKTPLNPNVHAEYFSLIKKYPVLLGDIMFECGPGWYELIDKLCQAIVELDCEVRATQVKEKYGQLRFYVDSTVNKVFDLIDQAEDMSATICEVCGKPGKLRGGGWMKTRCEECNK